MEDDAWKGPSFERIKRGGSLKVELTILEGVEDEDVGIQDRAQPC